jgi:hypothetical protein
MITRRVATVFCCLLLFTLSATAGSKDKKKDTAAEAPPMVMLWPPNAASPSIKLSFAKFTQAASYNGQLSLETNVLVENLSDKSIPQASFTVYMLDKDKVRVGSGVLNISDLDAGQQVKLPFQVFSVGMPQSLSLVARNNGAGIPTSLKTVPLKVISTPPGANLKADGQDMGVTPAMVNLTIGNHTLEFSKEGFATGSTPIDIRADEAPGGSISFELGGLSQDEVELRDGKVLKGDAISLSMTSIIFRVDGKDETYDRNQVKKIILVQRETVQQPVVVQPTPQPSRK